MPLKLLKNSIFVVKMEDFANFYAMLKWTLLSKVTKSVNH